MALPVRDQVKYWVIAAALFLIVLLSQIKVGERGLLMILA
jgi:hypothetical protein